jgi:hypothetical protein
VQAFAKSMGFSGRYALRGIIKDNLTGYRAQPSPYGRSFVRKKAADDNGCRQRLEQMNEENFKAVRDFEKYRHLLVQTDRGILYEDEPCNGSSGERSDP